MGLWALEPNTANKLMPLALNTIQGKAIADIPSEQQIIEAEYPFFIEGNSIIRPSSYGGFKRMEIEAGSIAIIPIRDVIWKYDQNCGPRGMETKANWIDEAMAHPNIDGVIIKGDSGGGQGDAMFRIASVIKNAKKPIIAYGGGGMLASAMYGVVSHCDEIYLTFPGDAVGSLGTYIVIPDWKKQAKKKDKLDTHVIHATESVDKNAAYNEALKGNYKKMREEVLDPHFKDFKALVQSGRGDRLSTSENVFTGKMYRSKAALKHGLIDGIASWEEVLNRMDELVAHNKNSNKSNKMFGKRKNNKTAAELMSAYAKSKPKNRSEEQVEDINNAIQNEGLGLIVLGATKTTKTVEDVNTGITSLTEEKTALAEKVSKLESKLGKRDAKIEALKAKIEGTPAAESGPSATRKVKDKLEEKSSKKENKAAIEALNPEAEVE